MSDRKTAFQIVVEFDKSLLQHFTVPAWNTFVADLMVNKLTPPAWRAGEKPEPIGILLDFRGLRRSHYKMDGIDLRMCWLENADFSGASLRNARLGCGWNISYRNARLHNADFRHIEISGCDFTGCHGLETAMFGNAVYDPECLPIGLPSEILSQCKAEADPPANPREPSNPMEPTGFEQCPLLCHASIHLIPIEK